MGKYSELSTETIKEQLPYILSTYKHNFNRAIKNDQNHHNIRGARLCGAMNCPIDKLLQVGSYDCSGCIGNCVRTDVLLKANPDVSMEDLRQTLKALILLDM